MAVTRIKVDRELLIKRIEEKKVADEKAFNQKKREQAADHAAWLKEKEAWEKQAHAAALAAIKDKNYDVTSQWDRDLRREAPVIRVPLREVKELRPEPVVSDLPFNPTTYDRDIAILKMSSDPMVSISRDDYGRYLD